MTENERLTIDEIIEHCNRTCENTEIFAMARGQKQQDIESKSYWEHYQVADYLEELKQYRAIETELRERYHANVDIKMLMQHFIETIFKGEKHEGFCILTNEDAKMWDEYRAIGTVEECKTNKVLADKGYKFFMDDIELLKEYRAIGTIEEFKALKEKEMSLSREIRHGDYFCPKCGSLVEYQGYCHACGQKVH